MAQGDDYPVSRTPHCGRCDYHPEQSQSDHRHQRPEQAEQRKAGHGHRGQHDGCTGHR